MVGITSKEVVQVMGFLTALMIVGAGFAQDEAPDEEALAPEGESVAGIEVTPPGDAPEDSASAGRAVPLMDAPGDGDVS